MHLAITDSGLGGLSVCAAIERAWRDARSTTPLRISYVNAWPEEGRGYNDFPDMGARAAVFDRALEAIGRLAPQHILIACNTLSILYASAAFLRRPAGPPVRGIIEAGVGLFERALLADATASIVLVGTKTTIESGVHRDALVQRGIAPGRVTSASCHGLATAIENGLADASTAALIETCAERAAATLTRRGPVFLGLCCTHYGMAARQLVDALAARAPGPVTALDPNVVLVDETMATLPPVGRGTPTGAQAEAGVRRDPAAVPDGPGASCPGGSGPSGASPLGCPPAVTVISKVILPAGKRENVGAILQATSPATSRALRNYTHVPDLF